MFSSRSDLFGRTDTSILELNQDASQIFFNEKKLYYTKEIRFDRPLLSGYLLEKNI